MKYYELDFTLTPCSQDAQDVLSALAGEAGCESFEETPTGLKAYIQQAFYDEDALRLAVEVFPFNTVTISYNVREAEDRDWNEQWEQEGFEPIVIQEARGKRQEARGTAAIVIHDGRHLPALDSFPIEPLSIEIDAHLAFGTGTHETTRMICSSLLTMNLEGQQVLDCGCGTGILGICALKLGARCCVSYDIDEWSADNTRHNAIINGVDDRLMVLCGDSSVLKGLATAVPNTSTTLPDASPSRFSLVMANINRNILLADMEHFVSVMQVGATLILSGFYENDCNLLESKAQELGLTLTDTRQDGDWACLAFKK